MKLLTDNEIYHVAGSAMCAFDSTFEQDLGSVHILMAIPGLTAADCTHMCTEAPEYHTNCVFGNTDPSCTGSSGGASNLAIGAGLVFATAFATAMIMIKSYVDIGA